MITHALIFPLLVTFAKSESKKSTRIDSISKPKTYYGISFIHNTKRPNTQAEWISYGPSEFLEFFFICHPEKLLKRCESAAAEFKQVSEAADFRDKMAFSAVDPSAKHSNIFIKSIGLTKEAVEAFPVFAAIAAPRPVFLEDGKLNSEETFTRGV